MKKKDVCNCHEWALLGSYFCTVHGSLNWYRQPYKKKKIQPEYATEKEMIEHCDKYPCRTCTIAFRCSMFEKLMGYLPEAPKTTRREK